MSTCFHKKLTYNGITFQLSDGASIDEREIHSYHEILYCIDANAMLLLEDRQKRIRGKELLVIPKGTYHFFELGSRDTFTRLKISFFDEAIRATPFPEITSKIRVLRGYNERIKFVLDRLLEILSDAQYSICDGQYGTYGLYAYSAFLMLLTEIEIGASSDESGAEVLDAGLLSSTLEYISKNLSKDLSIEALAKQMHVSASGIAHEFRKKLGISVHKYITQKRLIYAQERIRSGEQPSKIYSECGYSDYSCFYKAYVKFFGYAPSEEI